MYSQEDKDRVAHLREQGFEIQETLEIFNTTASGTSLLKITAPNGTVLLSARVNEHTQLAAIRSLHRNATNVLQLFQLLSEPPIFVTNLCSETNTTLHFSVRNSHSDDTLFITFKKGQTILAPEQKITERNGPILRCYSRDAQRFIKNLIMEDLLLDFKELEFSDYDFLCEQTKSEGSIYTIVRLGESHSRADVAQILIMKDKEEANIFSEEFMNAVKKIELLNAF